MRMNSARLGWLGAGQRLGLAAMALAGAVSLANVPKAMGEEVAKTFPVSGHAKVRVQTDDGAGRVSTGDIKKVEIRVEYTGYKLDKDLQISMNQHGDTVEITAKTHGVSFFNFGVRHASLRVEVHMPKDSDLDVTSGDGSVEADSVSGNLSIQTGDGHVNIEGRFDSLNIKTGDGSVSARAKGGSRVQSGWNIRTGDGSVDLEIPGDLKANIDASTHDGHISLGIPVTVEGSFSSSKVNGKMNGGGQPIIVRTGDGSIHLNKV